MSVPYASKVFSRDNRPSTTRTPRNRRMRRRRPRPRLRNAAVRVRRGDASRPGGGVPPRVPLALRQQPRRLRLQGVHQRSARALPSRGWGSASTSCPAARPQFCAPAGADMATVDFHGNNKTPQEIAQAVEWGVGPFRDRQFPPNCVSWTRRRARRGAFSPFLIRVSPSIDPHTHRLTTTGVLDSKFGFPIETATRRRPVRQAMAAANLDLRGAPLSSRLSDLRIGAVHGGDGARSAVRGANARTRDGTPGGSVPGEASPSLTRRTTSRRPSPLTRRPSPAR